MSREKVPGRFATRHRIRVKMHAKSRISRRKGAIAGVRSAMSASSMFDVGFSEAAKSGTGGQLTVEGTRSGYLIIIAIFW